MGVHLNASIWFSLFVLLGNPVIVLIIMGVKGYRCRTGFMAGLRVAQISEFSLIVAALGMNIGHISKETMGLITLAELRFRQKYGVTVVGIRKDGDRLGHRDLMTSYKHVIVWY